MAPRSDDPAVITDLQRFIDSVMSEAHANPPFTESDRDAILGLTGVAAHTVVRPAGPFAALAVGYLVGSGAVGSWEEAADAVKRHIRAYIGDPAPAPGSDAASANGSAVGSRPAPGASAASASGDDASAGAASSSAPGPAA